MRQQAMLAIGLARWPLLLIAVEKPDEYREPGETDLNPQIGREVPRKQVAHVVTETAENCFEKTGTRGCLRPIRRTP